MNVLHIPADRLPARDKHALDHEADHRIANNLGMIVSLLRLRARSVGKERGKMERADVATMLEEIATRVETVAQLHRMLSHSYRHALVDIGGYLRELALSLTRTLSPETKVEVTHDDTRVMPPDQVLTLGLLVSELVTNSVKYAHPAGLPVKIEIGCRENAGQLQVEVSDDGVGFPEGFDPHADGNLGLRVVRSLAAQLGGTLHFESDLGTRVRLSMPAPMSGAGAA